MYGPFVLVILIAFFPAAYLLAPRGTVLHELLHLPFYWWELFRTDTSRMKEERLHYGDHHRQYLLFIPPAETGGAPPDKLVVYFHGGGWKFGRPEKFKASVRPFHEAGYPVVLPSHRRIPHCNYYQMREDLNRILLTIRRLQKERGWHHQRIVLGGMSAGGNLAALLCYDHRALAQLGVPPSIFAGLLACAAPLALEPMRDSPLLRAFAGPRGSRQFRNANPVEHLREHRPPVPVFCVHGRCDGLVEYGCAAAFAKVLKDYNDELLRFVAPPRGTHLEAASWSHKDQDLKREILTWLQEL